MQDAQYPLYQLATIKKKRLEEAEKELIQKKIKLEQEEKILRELEEKRDEIKHHRDEKLTKFYEELSQGTTSDKIEQAQRYIQVVEEKLLSREKKVIQQEPKVKACQEDVEKAKNLVAQRQIDVEKLEIHKKEWFKEALKEEERLFNIEQDEIGNTIFLRKNKELDE